MSRRLIVLNAAIVLVALMAVAYVLRASAPAPSTARRPAPTAAPAVAAAPAEESTPPGGYSVVVARNLFSPTRSDTPVAPAGGPIVAKPNLFGILLSGTNPVAYLEDPLTKRVSGYRLGDNVAGGTLKQIAADHVVLNRPDGDINLRLRDPSKPRPPLPAVPGQPGATAPTPPVAAVPGPVVPGRLLAPPPTIPAPMQPLPSPAANVDTPASPGVPLILQRRPMPPNLRRIPPAGPDAPAQD